MIILGNVGVILQAVISDNFRNRNLGAWWIKGEHEAKRPSLIHITNIYWEQLFAQIYPPTVSGIRSSSTPCHCPKLTSSPACTAAIASELASLYFQSCSLLTHSREYLFFSYGNQHAPHLAPHKPFIVFLLHLRSIWSLQKKNNRVRIMHDLACLACISSSCHMGLYPAHHESSSEAFFQCLEWAGLISTSRPSHGRIPLPGTCPTPLTKPSLLVSQVCTRDPCFWPSPPLAHLN